MGYASLTYANDGSILSTTVLHDIVGCVTGRFSSSVQLQGATVATSEIVNTLGQNWNFTHPTSSSFIPTTPNVSSSSWVLTAPCVNPSKTKYVRLTNIAKNGGNVTVINSSASLNNQYISSSANCSGIWIQAATSASNANTLINQTWYNDMPATGTREGASVINGTNIIISWSSRHIVIWSNAGPSTGIFITTGYVEFPETDVTTAQNVTPAAMLIERNGNLTSSITTYGPSYTTNQRIPIGEIQLPSFYNPITAVTGPVSFNGLVNNTDILTSTLSNGRPTNTIPTINTSGTTHLMFVPLIINLMSTGNPIMYLSTFSNMYVVANSLGTGGDTITVGNDTYAYLPSNTGMSFVVRKG